METDKKQHIVVSFFLTLGAALLTRNAWLSAIIAFSFGLAKEIYDYYFGGVCSIEDMAANFVGIFAALLLLLSIQAIKEK